MAGSSDGFNDALELPGRRHVVNLTLFGTQHFAGAAGQFLQKAIEKARLSCALFHPEKFGKIRDGMGLRRPSTATMPFDPRQAEQAAIAQNRPATQERDR